MDRVLKYFDGFQSAKNVWGCPGNGGEKIDVDDCFECYLDALDFIDTEPENPCLSCNMAKHAVAKKKGGSFNHVINKDSVDHPEHYCSHPSGIECITITKHHDFCTGNAIKYIWRCGLKGGSRENRIEDLQKAKKYLEFAINKEIKGGGIDD